MPGCRKDWRSGWQSVLRMLELAKVKRILVIKPSSLGDILHIFPALAELRAHCPEATLDFLVHPAFADILDYSPFPVSEKILFERKKMGRVSTLVPEFLKLARELRRRKYDLVIDFQGLTRSALFASLTRGGPVIGFAHPREPVAKWFYSRRIAVEPGHALERNSALIGKLTGSTGPVRHPELPANPAALRKLEALVGPLPSRLIALIPGARWQSKQFPPALFAGIARRLHKLLPDYVFAIIGAAGDREIEQEIVTELSGEVPVLPLAGKTSLAGMMEVLRASSLVISNDSGPVHAAAALNKPVFAFFGPTCPEKTGPYGNRTRIYQLDIDCVRCMKRTCRSVDGLLPCHRLDADKITADAFQVLTQPQEN